MQDLETILQASGPDCKTMLLPLHAYYLIQIGIILISCISMLLSNAQSKKGVSRYNVKASLPNWDSTYVSIVVDGETLYADSVLNGGFEFSGQVKGIKEGFFIVKKKNINITIPLFIEAGITSIKDYGKNVARFDITGTPHNDLLPKFFKDLESVYPFPRGGSDEQFKVYQENKTKYIQQYIQTHPESLFTLTIFRQSILNLEMREQDKLAIFNSISKNIRNTYGGRELLQKINRLIYTSVGKTAPLFSSLDTANNKIALQQFRGKYVLLDFWASWCGPCREENPAIRKTFEEFKNKGFVIISVSLDTDKENWLNAINKDKLTWVHLSDLKGWNNSVAKQYYIQSVPANFLLNPEGVIIDKNLSGEALRAKLSTVL